MSLNQPVELRPRMSALQLTRRWRKSGRTLQRWRKLGCGPAYFRIGQTAYYFTDVIVAYEEQAASAGPLDDITSERADVAPSKHPEPCGERVSESGAVHE